MERETARYIHIERINKQILNVYNEIRDEMSFFLFSVFIHRRSPMNRSCSSKIVLKENNQSTERKQFRYHSSHLKINSPRRRTIDHAQLSFALRQLAISYTVK